MIAGQGEPKIFSPKSLPPLPPGASGKQFQSIILGSPDGPLKWETWEVVLRGLIYFQCVRKSHECPFSGTFPTYLLGLSLPEPLFPPVWILYCPLHSATVLNGTYKCPKNPLFHLSKWLCGGETILIPSEILRGKGQIQSHYASVGLMFPVLS